MIIALFIMVACLAIALLIMAIDLVQLRKWQGVLQRRIYELQPKHDCGKEGCYGPAKEAL